MFDFFKEAARILSYIKPDATTGKLTLDMVVNIQDPEGNYLLFVAPAADPVV